MKYVISIFLMTVCYVGQAQIVLLHENWEFKKVGNENWMAAEVPGTVHTDLFSNGIIGDPFYGNNEVHQKWIENENWRYRLEFDLEKTILKKGNIDLILEGLDTYALVKINEVEILSTSNMFRSWRIEIKKHLKRKNNVLEITFKSPIAENIEKAQNYIPLPGGVDTSEFPVAPFCRKAAFHFGWDWSPRFVTMGIWKPIYLEGWDGLRIENFYAEVKELNKEIATLNCEIQIQSSTQIAAQIDFADYGKMELSVEQGTNTYEVEIQIPNPDLWWPNGSGKQKLYEIDVQILEGKYLHDQITQKIGIREIELVNELDSIGKSFYFNINGSPLFMKGANYVPQDVFIPRVESNDYRKLLVLAKEAGMNMIRVWGGGIYENDIFYDLCDSLGLLVWQDFMFAGTMYPNKAEFRNDVEKEVKEQVLRLRQHPCIAVWCGNNEIDVAWRNWGWQNQFGYSEADSLDLWSGYESLFKKLLPEVVNEFHSTSQYIPSSPESNWGTSENFNFSSMHYWGVWHGNDDFDDFEENTGRFMVEYGFQSYPSFELLERYIPANELNIDSETMKMRQKSYVGNQRIMEFIEKYLPTNYQGFENFIESSQQVQALGLSIAIQAHIGANPRCMGTLIWQLNDSWPGPSWSIVQYDGKTKPAYQTAKKFFTAKTKM